MEFDPTWHHNRTDLASTIEKYYKGRKKSHIGMQYLTLKDGMIVRGPYSVERRDVLLVHGKGFSVFVEVDGRYHIQYNCEPKKQEWELTRYGKEAIARKVKKEVAKNADFIAAHEKFFADKPWEKCDGVTPEEAIEILRPYEFTVPE
jgi:hypothetical protein